MQGSTRADTPPANKKERGNEVLAGFEHRSGRNDTRCKKAGFSDRCPGDRDRGLRAAFLSRERECRKRGATALRTAGKRREARHRSTNHVIFRRAVRNARTVQ